MTKRNLLNWFFLFLDTGPHVDHTLGTDEGIYCYVEASYPQQEGDKTLLISDFIPPISNGCLELYYFMYGDSVGQFNIYMNDTINGQKILNNITGQQGFEWKQLEVSISNQNEFKLILEGVVSHLKLLLFNIKEEQLNFKYCEDWREL